MSGSPGLLLLCLPGCCTKLLLSLMLECLHFTEAILYRETREGEGGGREGEREGEMGRGRERGREGGREGRAVHVHVGSITRYNVHACEVIK